jgi:hypothetical protein
MLSALGQAISLGSLAVRADLGNALRLLGDTAGALDSFCEAVRLDLDLAVAHSKLGQFFLDHHQPHAALVHCRAAVRLRPTMAEGAPRPRSKTALTPHAFVGPLLTGRYTPFPGSRQRWS